MPILQYGGPSPFYKELAELPLPTSADFVQVNSTATIIRVSYSFPDHERGTRRSVTKTFTLSRPGSDELDFEPILTSTTTQDSSDIQAFAVSRSRKYQAILREITDPDGGGKKRFVEIWADLRLVASLDVTKAHGQFHTDDVFKSLSFSPSETALIYTAEANPETTEGPEDDPYPKHRFKPHFGEMLFTRQRPTLFMLRWYSPHDATSFTRVAKKDMSLTALTLPGSLSDTMVLGQAVFAKEGQVFVTGYEQTEDGRYLGIQWCFNRPASIWELTLPKAGLIDGDSLGASVTCSAVKIELPGRSCRSPRVFFDLDGTAKQLLWLSHALGGFSCSSLHVRDLSGETDDRVLVDAVSDAEEDQFPGLYTDFTLLANPFIYNVAPSIVMQSVWRSSATVVSAHLETGAVSHERMWFGGSPSEGWTILATDGVSQMVCSKSSLTSPPEVLYLTLNPGGEWVRRVLDRPTLSPKMQEALEDLTISVVPIPDRYPTEAVILRSKKASAVLGPKPYCVTFPHGGPHGVSTTSFAPSVAALALEGYTVSMPNYTGSVGYGDKNLQKLIGQIGTLDIGDCIASVEELIKLGISERGRQLVQGGSHGGFITGHLVGQYPDVFKAAIMQNPVTSLGEFVSSSDVPDWLYAEMGLPYSPGACVTPEAYKTFYEASPIAYVDKVRTPVLLIIGEDDRRVPPTQGKNYFHALKGRGRQVEILTFPGIGHALDGVDAFRIYHEATRDWFRASVTD
ncbi:hypothetical protein HYDPIDRAFT_115515 [Hydnomerulius pinastri MD-312]|uniref:acylaminoacyl-peptidase n=1 Tax=Hydnomerulius pinastri MD-312 TaxID=994086 RepID=A0A0C9W553_9AGAM|nr:hypothetical protein HYDPIDRAFT_115515 [Hydnomerulius pinastri MD-312]